MKCPTCKSELAFEYNYCPRCGADLRRAKAIELITRIVSVPQSEIDKNMTSEDYAVVNRILEEMKRNREKENRLKDKKK